MRLDYIRDHLTLGEIAARWNATEPDMRRAILKGTLRVALFLNEELSPVHVVGSGIVVGEERCKVSGWFTPRYVEQTGPLEYSFQVVSRLGAEVDDADSWALNEPCGMAYSLTQGVVFAADLAHAEELMEAEAPWQLRSARTKEQNTLLTMIAVLLADAYGYDAKGPNVNAAELEQASERLGHKLSEVTLRKWMRAAWGHAAPIAPPAIALAVASGDAEDAHPPAPEAQEEVTT